MGEHRRSISEVFTESWITSTYYPPVIAGILFYRTSEEFLLRSALRKEWAWKTSRICIRNEGQY
jgi:hypothetical protein